MRIETFFNVIQFAIDMSAIWGLNEAGKYFQFFKKRFRFSSN